MQTLKVLIRYSNRQVNRVFEGNIESIYFFHDKYVFLPSSCSNSQKHTSHLRSTFSLVNIVEKGLASSNISPFLKEHMFCIKELSNNVDSYSFLSRPCLAYISCTVCTCTVYSIVDVAHTAIPPARANWTGDIDRDLIWWYTPAIPGVWIMLFRFTLKWILQDPVSYPSSNKWHDSDFLSEPMLTWGAIIAICCSN